MTDFSTQRASAPVHVKREDQVPRWTNPRADEEGYKRAFYFGVAGTNFAANQLAIPVGQGCPNHVFSGEVIVHLLVGQVQFLVAGEPVDLDPGDYLFIPAGTEYSYRNMADTESRMLSMIGRVDEWPAKSKFEGVAGDLVIH